ncbi:MAG: cache domain-containing protein [Desulfobacula sp.]|uniref:cache domain-containing protein n=1 Tax=Desulfobacula sp. TaxID=2593537 RepID=UPI0025B874C3|nr:cache domain-containing protein [Desulfobacula sp.]MCD4720800.1 cache domain-containing protein [Desulfobacula sp.]
MLKKSLTVILGLIIVSCFAFNGFAGELTAQLCKDKVIAAAKLIEQNGEKAFDTLRDPKGEFRFGNGAGYIWVHNLDTVMVMHPIKPSLEGKNLSNLQDVNGVLFFVAFNEIAEEHGSGWVPYAWPKPGEKGTSPKISYVELVKYGDTEYITGAGMYDVTAADIKKQFPGDAIYED